MKKTTLLGATLLAMMGAHAQYQHGFEGSETMPEGFEVVNLGSVNGWTVLANPSGNAFEGTNVARLQWNSNAHDDYLILPEITVTEGVSNRLTFRIKSNSNVFIDSYEVLLSTTAGVSPSDFDVVLQTETPAPNLWDLRTFELNEYLGQTVRIAIRAVSADKYQLLVDNIINSQIYDCSLLLAAADATISDITSSTATLTFPAIDGANGYIITLTTPNGVETYEVEDSTFEFSNLAANTNYSFTVSAVCETSTGEPSDSISFLTQCTSITELDVVQGNEGTTGIGIDQCWSAALVSGTDNWRGFNSEDNELYVPTIQGQRVFGKSYNNSTADLISPSYNLSAMGSSAYRVQMNLYQRGTLGGPTDRYEVYVNTTATATGATLLGTVYAVVSGLQDGWYTADFTVPATYAESENVYFIVRGITNASWNSYGLGMDAFVVKEDNGCSKPLGLLAEAITTNSATISWEAVDGATEYEYFISTTNVAPTTSGVLATENTVELTDLMHSTAYYVWVRSVCGDEVYSDWSAVHLFSTNCDFIDEVDLIQGNEGTFNEAISLCWTAETVTGTTNWVGADSGDNELYVATTDGSRVFSKEWSNSVANLISPQYNLAAIGLEYYQVSMNLYQRGTNAGATDKYVIMVNSAPSEAGAVILGEEMSRLGDTFQDGWFTHTYQVPAFFSSMEAVYFIVKGITDSSWSSYGLGMDAFVVSEGESLSTGDYNTAQFVAYPNPVTDVLNLRAEFAFEKVNVFNALGQEVMVSELNGNNSQLDMSHLPKGTYFVKVTAQEASKTIKVVKQ